MAGAFRKTGVKPAEFRSSIEAMARRVAKGQELPSINALVDIGNVLSLRHLVPTGGHALDDVRGDLVLRAATGEETFVPFGGTETEHPLPGEIVFAEGDVVLTRRWSWRQGVHTLTLPESTSIEFNVDGLPRCRPARSSPSAAKSSSWCRASAAACSRRGCFRRRRRECGCCKREAPTQVVKDDMNDAKPKSREKGDFARRFRVPFLFPASLAKEVALKTAVWAVLIMLVLTGAAYVYLFKNSEAAYVGEPENLRGSAGRERTLSLDLARDNMRAFADEFLGMYVSETAFGDEEFETFFFRDEHGATRLRPEYFSGVEHTRGSF